MSRFDKYEPRSGGFRAKLEAAIVGNPAGSPTGETDDIGVVRAVSLNSSGRVVRGGAADAIVGVICPVRPMAAGETIDVMTDGEIADFTLQNGSAAAAGTKYYAIAADADGNYTDVATANHHLGWTVEASRLIVRVGR